MSTPSEKNCPGPNGFKAHECNGARHNDSEPHTCVECGAKFFDPTPSEKPTCGNEKPHAPHGYEGQIYPRGDGTWGGCRGVPGPVVSEPESWIHDDGKSRWIQCSRDAEPASEETVTDEEVDAAVRLWFAVPIHAAPRDDAQAMKAALEAFLARRKTAEPDASDPVYEECVVCNGPIQSDDDAESVADNNGGQEGRYAHRECDRLPTISVETGELEELPIGTADDLTYAHHVSVVLRANYWRARCLDSKALIAVLRSRIDGAIVAAGYCEAQPVLAILERPERCPGDCHNGEYSTCSDQSCGEKASDM